MSKEVMRQALEALEDLIPLCDPGFSICYDVNKAITALREALAEQPAQQEPVAWCVINNGEIIGEPTLYLDGAEEILAGQIEGCGSEIAPLYTSPPAQRTWVGLTDEEIARVVSLAGFSPDWAEAHIATQIVRVLEAKLKEKNT